MIFAAPVYLILLAVMLPLAIIVLVRYERRRRADIVTFGEESLLARLSLLPGTRQRAFRQGLVLLALSLGLVALARPQLGAAPVTLTGTGRDVLLVLDLSRSMNAEDVGSSRLEAAKRAARALVRASPGDRVGLVIFGGSAFLQLPLTLDRSALDAFLTAASTRDIPDVGTNLAAAVGIAAAAFEREGEPGRRAIVVLSDGEDLDESMEDAIGIVKRHRIPVFAVGVGSLEGAPIPAADSTADGATPAYHRNRIGQVVSTRLVEGNLDWLARESGGAYVRWQGEASVRPLVTAMSRLTGRDVRSRTRAPRADRFQWLLVLACLALVAEWLLPIGQRGRKGREQGGARRETGGEAPGRGRVQEGAVKRRSGVAVLALAMLAAGGGIAAQDMGDGVKLYRAGRYREAFQAFQAIVHARSRARDWNATPALDYNSGNALYRLGRYDEALASFRKALTGPPTLRARAYFNIGNSYIRLADSAAQKRSLLLSAINSYEEVLLIDPRDADAKWNLELARRMLADHEEPAFGGRYRRANWGGGNLTKSGYAGTPETPSSAVPGGGYPGGQQGEEPVPEMSESNARQLLRAVEQAQLSGQQTPSRQSARRGASRRRDW